MFRSCQWKGCRKACLPCSACWRRWVLACSKSTTHKTSREPWTGRHGFGIWRTHTDFPQFCFPWQCRVYLGQHRHRGRPCLYLCPNTKWPHNPHQNLQQSRPAVRGRGGAGALWRPSGTLVDSTNQHLRRTLLHPDVQSRGCTHVETSLYGCGTEDLSKTMAEELLAEALALATPCGDECCAIAGHPPCGADAAPLPAMVCLLYSCQRSNGETTHSVWTAAWCWGTIHKE